MLQLGRRHFKTSWFADVALGRCLGRTVIFVFGLIVIALSPVASAGSGRQPLDASIAFNIPSQPLGAALEAYARISRREVLYDGAFAAGRNSSLVEGVYKPEVALQILLAGTGLWASFKDAEFFVVGVASVEKSTHAAASRRSAEHMRYYSRLQAGLKTAFCGSAILPEGRRLAARLWVGQQGRVLQVRKLASTGSGELDQRVDTILHGLTLGGPPPAGFAQPITIVILPSDAKQDCDSARSLPVVAGP